MSESRKTWQIPRVVRPLLAARVETLLEEVAGSGPPPAFLSRDLLGAVEEACGEAGCPEAIDAIVEHAEVDELSDPKLRRRIEPGLAKVGTYEAGRWSYPAAEVVLALLEKTYGIAFFDPAPDEAPSGPPADVAPIAYTPDTPLSAGAWIVHPKLGTGYVVEAKGDRIRVRFSDRERTLLHRAVEAKPRMVVASPEVAAAHACLDADLDGFVAEWRALGHAPEKTFLASCVGKPGLHPVELAKRCIAMAETRFRAKLSRRTRTYDDEHGYVQRVPDRLLHEFYGSPVGVLAHVVTQRVRPSGTDDEVVSGLEAEITRRIAR